MNTEQARFNMIEQQIRPWNVLDQDVLALLGAVKREDYFPDDQKSMAFFDTELALPGGAHSLSPKVEARIVQGVAVKKHETVLLIGSATGYLAALLAHQARHVTVMEAIPELKAIAEANLRKNSVNNVDVQWCDALRTKHANTYDVIVVSGSLESLPIELQQQLTNGGRLFVVVGKAPVMKAQIITRESELFFNTVTLFETSVQRLSQAAPESTFTF
jgi:protein-L-isoaspartate(D-aspartate) O-methyltransferase